MTDSSRHPYPSYKKQTPKHEDEEEEEEEHHHHQQQQQNTRPNKRLCDFCGELQALLYCRADSAKLCFACDREVHSTNQLFTKHTRSQLCDSCDASPASILCFTETLVLCQNCDWERHNGSASSIHDRRPLEGFTGCPSVTELCSIVGAEDMGTNKALLLSDENGGDCLDGSGLHGFSDFLVWETPSVVSLDDLIGSTDSSHGFQAMGVPPLPKNRNAVCGRHKDEILHQLRELAKLEPDLNYNHEDAKPLVGFQPLVPEQSPQPRNKHTDCERDADSIIFPSYDVSAFQWGSDSREAPSQVHFPSTLLGIGIEESCLVPDKYSDIGGSVSHANDNHERQTQHPLIPETLPILAKVASHEFNSQDRDTALSRYKEKKKTRRYDKHIRYESRKARAESRTRIKGRFAKIDH